jgi:hypothetical protein
VSGKECFDHQVDDRIGRLGRYADQMAGPGDGAGIEYRGGGIDFRDWLERGKVVAFRQRLGFVGNVDNFGYGTISHWDTKTRCNIRQAKRLSVMG